MRLREAKKAATRDALQEAALRLFAERGYGGTSCADVAAAAGVSPATLFRYFPTKEDLVLHDVYDPMIAQAVLARPAQEGPVTATHRALVELLAGFDAEAMRPVRQRTALVLGEPALRARSHEQRDSMVVHLANAYATRLGLPADDVKVSVVANVAAVTMSVAVERWGGGAGDLAGEVDTAFRALTEMDAPSPRTAS
jgi:AcrR family transcriptional regulator